MSKFYNLELGIKYCTVCNIKILDPTRLKKHIKKCKAIMCF